MARLTNLSVAEIQANRLAIAQKKAVEWQKVVVLLVLQLRLVHLLFLLVLANIQVILRNLIRRVLSHDS
jgi:hypothetical protein